VGLEHVLWWTTPSLHLVVALVATGMAALLMLSDPRRNWNQILALYLLLIGINFLAQAVDGFAQRQDRYGWTLISPAAQRAWGRVGAIAFVLDPAALLYFVSIFPRRTGLARHWSGALILGIVAGSFVVAELTWSAFSGFWRSFPQSHMIPLAFFVLMSAVYLYACFRMAWSCLHEPSQVMGRQVRFIAMALMIALLPRVAIVPWELRRYWQGEWTGSSFEVHFVAWLAYLLVAWGAFVVIRYWSSRRSSAVPAARARLFHRDLRIVGAFLAFYSLVITAHLTFQWAPDGSTLAAYRASHPLANPAWFVLLLDAGPPYAVRWIVFAALVFYGIVRFQVLAVRGNALRALAMITALALIALLGAGLAVLPGAAVGGALAGLVGAAAAFLAFRFLLAPRQGNAAAYLHVKAIDAYRSALASAMVDGQLPLEAENQLERTRRRLGVRDREHHMLLGIAQAEQRPDERLVLLGRYPQLRRLGTGAYASVFLARAPDEDTHVAIKLYERSRLGTTAIRAAAREYKVAQRVSHPNLIAIHDVVQTPDAVGVVMEFAAGGSLRDYLAEAGILDPEEARRIIADALEGLHAVHEAGLLHGDLKPENILLDRFGRAKLADFGSTGRPRATAASADPDRTIVGPGTARYEAPEVALGAPASVQSDLYAIGLIALECLTGRTLSGDNVTSTALAAIPGQWRTILEGALAIEPEARYRSAAAMRAALDPPRARDTRGWRRLGWGSRRADNAAPPNLGERAQRST
jgi:hypothetical protein